MASKNTRPAEGLVQKHRPQMQALFTPKKSKETEKSQAAGKTKEGRCTDMDSFEVVS